jgi:hypothetical protein
MPRKRPRLSVTIPSKTKMLLTLYAQQDGRSVSNLVARAVEKMLDAIGGDWHTAKGRIAKLEGKELLEYLAAHYPHIVHEDSEKL